MRIAIAIDQDAVAQGFGCCPFVMIAAVEDGRIRESLLIPNTGASHEFWADLFFRNKIKTVIAGSMGPTAQRTMTHWGIQPILGASGSIDDVVRRFVAGELVDAKAQPAAPEEACTA